MKLASFRIESRPKWGLIEGQSALDMGSVFGDSYPDLKARVATGGLEPVRAEAASALRRDVAVASWLPVVPNPRKIFCAGLNCELHRKETGRPAVEHPTIFARFVGTQTGHLADIVRPRASAHLDFEGELDVIIGKPGRYISKERAFEHVAGFACYNDGGVRDWPSHPSVPPGQEFPEHQQLRTVDGYPGRVH